jgi:hypothetical protein
MSQKQANGGVDSPNTNSIQVQSQSLVGRVKSRTKVPYPLLRWLCEPIKESPWNIFHLSYRRQEAIIEELDICLDKCAAAFRNDTSTCLPAFSGEYEFEYPFAEERHRQTRQVHQEQPEPEVASLYARNAPDTVPFVSPPLKQSEQQHSISVSPQLALDEYTEQLLSKFPAKSSSHKTTVPTATLAGPSNAKADTNCQLSLNLSQPSTVSTSDCKSPGARKGVPRLLLAVSEKQVFKECKEYVRESLANELNGAVINGQDSPVPLDCSPSLEISSCSDVSLEWFLSTGEDSSSTRATSPAISAREYRDTDELQSYEIGFHALLQAYGVGRQCPTNEPNKDSRGTPSSDQILQNNSEWIPAKRLRVSSSARSDGEDNQSDLSEGDERGRSPKRKKASQHARLPGRRFACPFHKFDPSLYVACEEWS